MGSISICEYDQVEGALPVSCSLSAWQDCKTSRQGVSGFSGGKHLHLRGSDKNTPQCVAPPQLPIVDPPVGGWPSEDYDTIWTVTLDAKGNLTLDNDLCEGIDSASLPATAPLF